MATYTTAPHSLINPAIDDPVDEDLWGSQIVTNNNNITAWFDTRVGDYDFAGYKLVNAKIEFAHETKYDFSGDISSNAVTIDYENGNYQYATIDDDVEITLSNFPASSIGFLTLRITQDGTGGHAVTFDATHTIRTPDGSALVPDTAANAVNKYRLESEGGVSTVDVFLNRSLTAI